MAELPPGDLLISGDEREPWRPTRRHWTVVGVLAVVAAVLVPVALVVRHDQEQRRLDRLAINRIALHVTTQGLTFEGPTQDSTVELGFRNDGTEAVTLVAYQVLAPGFRRMVVNQRIARYELRAIDVPATAVCSPSLLTDLPRAMRVELKTVRGQSVTRDLNLISEGGPELQDTAQNRCHFVPPDRALQISGDGVATGKVIDVTLDVANSGRLPLSIKQIGPPPGMTLLSRPRVPLALVPQGSFEPTSTVLELRLRISDCTRWAGLDPRQSEGTAAFYLELSGPDGQGAVAQYEPTLGTKQVQLSAYAISACG